LLRWLLVVGGFRTALQWLILTMTGFMMTPQIGAVINLVLVAYWALFAAAAWQGARERRPLVWLFWEGIFSVALMVLAEVQLLFPVTLGSRFAWIYLLLLPLPLVAMLGFVWSAFSRTRTVA
jgi:hypothetical protein